MLARRVAVSIATLLALPGVALAQLEPPPEVPPVGAAAPPTAAGTTGLDVRPGIEVFAQYGIRFTRTSQGDTRWFHILEVPRAHGSLSAELGPVRARVVIEAVRSASEGALTGVAGDSLVLRLREAYAGWQQGEWLTAQAGVVPTLTIPELDGTWTMRAVAATPLEATGLASPADLGATARVTLPHHYGWVGAGVYDGEGYTNRELNRGKNLEVAFDVHPAPAAWARPFGVFASYVMGSSGTGRARADRVTAALLWQGRRLRGGVAGTYAWGLEDQGARRSLLGDVFVHAEPIDRLLLGVRGGIWLRDTRGDGDRVTTVTAAVGWRLARPLEAFLAGSRSLPDAKAEDALPGSDFWDFRLVTRVVF